MMEGKILSAFHTAVSWESVLCLQGMEAQGLGFKHLPFPHLSDLMSSLVDVSCGQLCRHG